MKKSEFYNDYKKARDKAWDIIIKYKVSTLPVEIFNLCDRMGIYTISYKNAKETVRTHNLTPYTVNNDGFATIINGHYIIFYDDSILPKGRVLFTIGHELGHIVLGHLKSNNISCRNGATVWNRGEVKEPNSFETAANIFSSRLLAPACVLWALDIHDSNDIAELCGLSKSASQVRASRMALLYEREREWLQRYNKSCFGLSLNEKKALKQFQGFIHNRIKKE